MLFAQKHGERIIEQLGLVAQDDWQPDLTGIKAGFGLDESTERLTHRELQARRAAVRREFRAPRQHAPGPAQQGIQTAPLGLARPDAQRTVDAAPLPCDQKVTYSGGMDTVFRALADPTRRSLLDALFRDDGQTLGALEQRFDMSRFGVMKHLAVLEAAGLVVTRRRGREKLHYLNPVPLRLIHDRWVSKYTEPWAAALSEMKERLEGSMEKVFEIYIKTTPERLWATITNGNIRSKFIRQRRSARTGPRAATTT